MEREQQVKMILEALKRLNELRKEVEKLIVQVCLPDPLRESEKEKMLRDYKELYVPLTTPTPDDFIEKDGQCVIHHWRYVSVVYSRPGPNIRIRRWCRKCGLEQVGEVWDWRNPRDGEFDEPASLAAERGSRNTGSNQRRKNRE